MRKRDWEKKKLQYAVGALLYCPATNPSIADSIINGEFETPYSVALCLEDSICDSAVEAAEEQLISTLKKIHFAWEEEKRQEDLPLIFIRVRSSKQIRYLINHLNGYTRTIAGFIFPKFDVVCAGQYNQFMRELNSENDSKLYMMPIIESKDIINLRTRIDSLYQLKDMLHEVSDLVLNIRVGGNDFCNGFGVRRHCDETIYDIRPVSNILSDILTVFSDQYIVSGPVWEYFCGSEKEWKNGMQREVRLDMLNGFIGKTVIHPNQISVVNSLLRVKESDYQDALEIMSWEEDILGVAKSGNGTRMNERKTHMAWAEKILNLADIYGVRENE